MRLNLINLAVLLLFLSGCVTPKGNLGLDVGQLQSRINYLETELKRKQDENLYLKQELANAEKRIATLSTEVVSQEKATPTMPNAKQIQTALKNARFYKGDIDGQIGPKTKEAIKKFQDANGLNPDGVVGSRTWELLSKYLEPKLETE